MMRWTLLVIGALTLTLGASCESDGGTSGGTATPQEHTLSGTVTLQPEEAFVLAGGRHVVGAEANIQIVDLVAYAHNDTIEIHPGSPSGHMMVLRRGGRPDDVDALTEVPDDAPVASDNDILVDPEVGNGFTVKGNVTDGHARFRVLSGPKDGASLHPSVTLEYDIVWWD